MWPPEFCLTVEKVSELTVTVPLREFPGRSFAYGREQQGEYQSLPKNNAQGSCARDQTSWNFRHVLQTATTRKVYVQLCPKPGGIPPTPWRREEALHLKSFSSGQWQDTNKKSQIWMRQTTTRLKSFPPAKHWGVTNVVQLVAL